MKIKDNLKPLIETWDDPGDYPNALAAGPLPSHKYVEGIEGELVIELVADEYQEFQETLEAESLDFWVREVLYYALPEGVLSAEWQLDKTEPGSEATLITLSIKEVEADPDYRGPESDGDWEYHNRLED